MTLWAAAKANDVAELERLLDGGAEIDAKDPRGYSALMLAAYSGSEAALDVLLARGADPRSADPGGNTVLMGAAFKGHASMVEKLLAAGADPHVKSGMGLDASGFAQMFGQHAIVEILDRVTARSVK
jgi:ankyrin repeat protein